MQIDFAGALCGLFYAGLLTAFTLLVFFAAVPFQNLWHVPVAACMAADDVSVCHVLAAGAVALSFACAGGACGTAWDHCGCYRRSAVVFTEQLFFVCGIGSSFYGGISACLCADGKWWDLIRELFNPTVLYATSGGWFMENDLRLSFAGNEFAVLFCSGTATVCLMAVGKRRYHRLEV